VLEESEIIIGYERYLSLIRDFWPGRKVLSSGMRKELARCREAISLAGQGKRVALISGGDPGVYGLAGPALELLLREKEHEEIEVEIVPGLSAMNAAASVLGAPLMNDVAIISLSDLLTPWPVIKKRLKSAAEGDFVTALYNPKSKKRISQILEAQAIFLQFRPSHTPVGVVHNALRDKERKIITTLDEFTGEEITMLSLVIIGNSQTYTIREKIITPRGYERVYEPEKLSE
jgi:precorrin-3B C17-methyltransferase